MISSLPGAGTGRVVGGRLLSYAAVGDAFTVYDLVAASQPTGLLLRGRGSSTTVRTVRAIGAPNTCVGLDLGAWSTVVASPDAPMELPQEDGGLFPIDLAQWADDRRLNGADFVLTPSRFVRSDDWLSLRRLLQMASFVRGRGDVFTLIATEGEMLDSTRFASFLRVLRVHGADQQFAFVFADRERPLARRRRLIGLRVLLTEFPGSLVVGTEVLAGTDVIARGGAAAIGLTSSLRRPRRPWDIGGGPPAKDRVPGLFLRNLWETRSPSVYADWYANSRTPACDRCDRAVDRFTAHHLHRQQVLRHNVHAWLEVLSEITGRTPAAAQEWLTDDRVRGLAEHLALNAVRTPVVVDAMLRAYCELDDSQGRRVAPSGAWY